MMSRFPYACLFLFAAACQSVVLVDDQMDSGGTAGDTETNTETDTDTDTDTGTDTDSTTATADTETSECGTQGPSSLACHEFESDIPADQNILNGTISLDTEQVFAGNGSMKSETTQINSFANILDGFDPIESGTVYFRLHLYVPGGTILGNANIFNLSAEGESSVDESRGVDVNLSAGNVVNIYQHGNMTRFESAPQMVPEDVWFCLRGSYTISQTAGETTVWIDDNLAVSTTASAEAIINGGVSETRTGIGWTEGNQDTAVVYFDNVRVETVPVPCFVPNTN